MKEEYEEGHGVPESERSCGKSTVISLRAQIVMLKAEMVAVESAAYALGFKDGARSIRGGTNVRYNCV